MPDSFILLWSVLLDLVLLFPLLRCRLASSSRSRASFLHQLCQRLFDRRGRLGFRVKPCAPAVRRTARKPAWVKREVLRLAALTDAGCRTLEKLFNRLYARRRAMTVGKSYVSYTIRDHLYEIEVLRRELLALEALESKNTWTLLGRLFLVIGRFGRPRMLRTDNESMFCSAPFRLALWIAGIRQQFTVPGCPWQNGRIERLFGTLKEKLDRMEVYNREGLAGLLAQFRFWYNAVRPHQHLGGLTPEEAWRGIDPYARAPKAVHPFDAWDGLLRGYYLRH